MDEVSVTVKDLTRTIATFQPKLSIGQIQGQNGRPSYTTTLWLDTKKNPPDSQILANHWFISLLEHIHSKTNKEET